MGLLFLDVETSTLDPKEGCILQIGCIHPRTKAEFNVKINPKGYKISQEAIDVTGIDVEDLYKTGISELEAVRKLQAFVKGEIDGRANVVAHNAHFDKAWIEMLFSRTGESFRDTFHFIWEDTLPFFKILASRKVIFPKNFKQETLAEYFGIERYKAHDAVADCRALVELYHIVHRMCDTIKKDKTDWNNLWKD